MKNMSPIANFDPGPLPCFHDNLKLDFKSQWHILPVYLADILLA